MILGRIVKKWIEECICRDLCDIDAEARVILSLMQELDPEDRCGGSVIMSLAAALDEEAA